MSTGDLVPWSAEEGCSVSSCTSVNLTLPKVLYHVVLDRLVVLGDAVGHFLVTDVKVGRNSQFCGLACLPAAVFSGRSLYRHGFDLLREGESVTVSLTNAAPDRREVRVRLVGRRAGPGNVLGKVARQRDVLVGLGHTLVPLRQHVKLTVQSTCLLDLTDLVVSSDVAPDFDVLSVVVGERVVWTPPGGRTSLPADSFVEDFCEPPLWDDPVRVRPVVDFVTVEVRNRVDGARAFTGALVGKKVD